MGIQTHMLLYVVSVQDRQCHPDTISCAPKNRREVLRCHQCAKGLHHGWKDMHEVYKVAYKKPGIDLLTM